MGSSRFTPLDTVLPPRHPLFRTRKKPETPRMNDRTDRKFESFEDFWPYYVMEHKEKATRWLHFAGTTAGFACVAGAIVFKKRWLFLAAPVVGYGASWIGHFFV